MTPEQYTRAQESRQLKAELEKTVAAFERMPVDAIPMTLVITKGNDTDTVYLNARFIPFIIEGLKIGLTHHTKIFNEL